MGAPHVGSGSGLRERKKAATRSSLRTAAVRLYRRHGPDAVTVEDVCAEVGVSPRTFFNYFNAKDEALFGLDQQQSEELAAEVAQRPATEDALVAARAVLQRIVDDRAGTGLWQEQMLLLREHPELLPRLYAATRATEQALASGIARRTDRTLADPFVRTASAVAMTSMRVATVRWLDSPEGVTPGSLLVETVDMIRSGLTDPTGDQPHT